MERGMERGMAGQSAEDPVAVLRRWEASGAGWRVARRGAGGLEIELLTCTGGEVVDRLRSADPALLGYVGDREASDD